MVELTRFTFDKNCREQYSAQGHIFRLKSGMTEWRAGKSTPHSSWFIWQVINPRKIIVPSLASREIRQIKTELAVFEYRPNGFRLFISVFHQIFFWFYQLLELIGKTAG